MTGNLTAAKVASIREPGMFPDGGGLYFRVAKGGSMQWMLRATFGGRRREMGLGAYPAVSLAKAREKRLAILAAIADGRDPLAEKREAQRKADVPTFREAARQYHAANLPRWSAKHGKQWIETLEKYAGPVIGDRPVNEIGRGDVLDILAPIWTEKPAQARKVRASIKAVFGWADAHGHIGENAPNPAGEKADGALRKMPAVAAHMKALPYRDVPDALDRIEASKAWPMTKACLRFIVLTAVRGGEARGATWDEIDLDAATWTIPAARMKARRDHRVPLSPAALAVLEGCKAFRGGKGSGLVFPSSRAARIGDSTLQKLLRTNRIDCVPHGFRSSFRDWCGETGKPWDVAEAALAHTVQNSTAAAYYRTDLLERRRAVMADWARFLDGEAGAKVVRLHG
ncbi:MAG: tyrosine-type recombinase/integrase [Rhodospirillaceae bacterium]|nr:tyrosine-type recombinase/integrase [Rhodospirillaceae bacterium]